MFATNPDDLGSISGTNTVEITESCRLSFTSSSALSHTHAYTRTHARTPRRTQKNKYTLKKKCQKLLTVTKNKQKAFLKSKKLNVNTLAMLKHFKNHVAKIIIIYQLTYQLTSGKMWPILKDKESDSCSLEPQKEMPTGKDRKQVANFL